MNRVLAGQSLWLPNTFIMQTIQIVNRYDLRPDGYEETPQGDPLQPVQPDVHHLTLLLRLPLRRRLPW